VVHATEKKAGYGEWEIKFNVSLDWTRKNEYVFFVIEKNSLLTGKTTPIFKSENKKEIGGSISWFPV